MTRRHLVLVGLAVALVVPLGLVAQKEYVLRRGDQIFLELAPVDPRSLLEGDYMRLAYGLTRQVSWPGLEEPPTDGHLVLALDDRRIARLVRVDDGRALAPGELRLRFRRRRGELRVGTDAFYFQEGQAERYAPARYGELRLTASGEAVLVGLRGARLEPL
jgi:uncharacterized membrane-anchored protein